MKAHELAKKLLACPDYEVVVCGDTALLPEGAFMAVYPNETHNTDGTVEMVVIIDLLEE